MNLKSDRCECGKPVKIKAPGLCGTCYGRQWRANTLVRTTTRKSETIKQRFYQRFVPEPNSGCWLWVGTITNSKGYGELTLRKKKHSAHRLSYEIHNGPIPKGMHVLHKCDVPSCVNPFHLFLGTNDDNVRDRDSKERVARGERAGAAKLTRKQVIAIRNMSDATADIAATFGIAADTVRRIKSRTAWSWLPQPVDEGLAV